MNITYYTQEQFTVAVKPYEEYFNAELMPIKEILKLPKWGMAKKIIYVIMNNGADVVGFARVQPVRITRDIKSRYYGEQAAYFIQYLYDIQDLFIFKKYRGQKLCTMFITYIRNTAPVEKMSLFVVSVAADNVPAVRCYKRAEFIDIDPYDALAKHFNEFWKRIDLKYMIISRQTVVFDNDKLNDKIKKLMNDEFGISNIYVEDMIYLTNPSGIVAKGPGILNIRFMMSFGEHYRYSIDPEITEAYILEIIKKAVTIGPVTKAIKAGQYRELTNIDPEKVTRVHKLITNWAWEVAPLD
jgi:hypothetical protein